MFRAQIGFLIALLLTGAQDTLRVKVSLVTVGVRVTDLFGRDVRGLKAADFSVFDDGAPQKIEFFSSDEQPITLGILLDRSDSMGYTQKLDRAKDAARALVRGQRTGSEFFYFTFDHRVKREADLTNDPQRIQAAIDSTRLGGGTALYDAVIDGLGLAARGHQARQAIVIISDGTDQDSRNSLDRVLRAVRGAKLQVFTIGYFAKNEAEILSQGGRKITLVDGRIVDNSRWVLERLAKESGADAFFPRSDHDLAKAVEKIANDLRTQYTLAFYPRSSDDDIHYHELRVVVRGGRYRVRARPGYGGGS